MTLCKRVSYSLVLIISLSLVLGMQTAAVDFGNIEELIHTKDLAQIEEAIKRLENHLTINSDDGEGLWMMAKAHLYLGDQTEDDKLEVYEAGKAYAEAAMEFLPASPHPYFWQASLIGRIGETKGIMSSLFMVRPMKDALDQVLEFDPNYADAHWFLSQLYHQAPGFPLSIGNKESSLKHAEKAVQLKPADLNYQVQLAVALEYNGKKRDAISLLEELMKSPALEQEPDVKADAQKLLLEFSK